MNSDFAAATSCGLDSVLPIVLWFSIGILISLLTAIRLQVVVLAVEPGADWLAVGVGLLVGGGVLALICIVGLGWRSLRKMGLAISVAPLLFLGLGYYGIAHSPGWNTNTSEHAVEWAVLHPTLRLALWLVSLEDRRMVMGDGVRESDADVGLGQRATSPRNDIHGDGYVLSVDLHVSRVGETRKWARQGLFLLMGLVAEWKSGDTDRIHLAL